MKLVIFNFHLGKRTGKDARAHIFATGNHFS